MDYNDLPYERWASQLKNRLKIVLITFCRPMQRVPQPVLERRLVRRVQVLRPRALAQPRYRLLARVQALSYPVQPGRAHRLARR